MSKVGFFFPGQGAQHVGMGKKLAERPVARALFDRAGEILGYDLSQLCFEGPAERLDATVVSQPALYVCSLAALEVLKVEQPAVVDACEMAAGLSLGEYTALTFAGALSFEEGLRVVQRRGEAMQAAADSVPSGMVSALLMEQPAVEEVCREASSVGQISIANYLCPGNIVLSGEKAAVARATELIAEKGGRPVPLAVAGAFHTSIMEPAVEQLRDALASVEIRKPRLPVLSNVDAKSHDDPAEIRELLVRQVVSPVLWEATVRGMLAAGVNPFYEIGPGKVLRGLLKRIDRKATCETFNDSEAL